MNDDSNTSTTKENIAKVLLNNINVLLADTTAYSPAGTTSTTLVMAGYAQTFTPKRTGRALIIMNTVLNNNTPNDGVQAQISYGTGAAPAAGAAVTGFQVGALVSARWDNVTLVTGGTTGTKPAVLVALVQGLTVGTTYWLDAAYSAITGGTATISILSSYVIEF